MRLVCAQRVDHSEYPAMCPHLWPAATAQLRSESLRGPKAWFADFGAVRIGGRWDFFTLEAQNGANWVGQRSSACRPPRSRRSRRSGPVRR